MTVTPPREHASKPQPRGYLYHLQATLNDVHMQLTDAAALENRELFADEVTLLQWVDTAIMHTVAMRRHDALLDHQLHVQETTNSDDDRSPLHVRRQW